MASNQLDWLREHGVHIDHKGRIVVSLPVVPDGDVYDRDPLDEHEPSIAELMRHDIDLRHVGSRGRRRRGRPKAVKHDNCAAQAQSLQSTRIGRPMIGAEVRVYVQTSIAQRTRELLASNGLTLAEVFDDYARQLPDAS